MAFFISMRSGQLGVKCGNARRFGRRRVRIRFIPPGNEAATRGTDMDRMAGIENLVLVVDPGSSSAAARRLNVGQPAVSKLVAQLEDSLGVKLLVRTTRGLTATEAGMGY